MREHLVDLSTVDGVMNTFIVHPEEGGPHPVVLFLMDAPGMREEIRDMSRRLASAGYYVVAGNLFYRRAREWNRYEFGGTQDEMRDHLASLRNEMIVSDAGVMIEHAIADQAADATRVGTLGYCMSGPFALMTAARHNDRVRAAISIHGVKLATDRDDSPHRHLDAVRGEIYVGAAALDTHIDVQEIETFRESLERSPATGRVEWYPDTHHGFAFAGRGPIYDRDASERHWERVHATFERNLKRN